ncbi:MAG: hypothetical protein ACRC9O_03635, partial [Plesiomonas sp.]|uniref:hypothetical protein n=1 Tax=Plesiomonas sp. TaxID=2486279 RepID=UPI003F39B673
MNSIFPVLPVEASIRGELEGRALFLRIDRLNRCLPWWFKGILRSIVYSSVVEYLNADQEVTNA